jgi:hypothetical protein
MKLQISKFDDKQIEKNGIGAGIIPISEDENNNYYVLLAKETFNPSWKQSNRWSGFEGGRKGMETILETAIREFKEESLEVIKFPNSIEDILIWKQYNLRLVINIQQERSFTRYHSTYVLKVPWQPECVLMFDHIKEKLLNIQECGSILQKLSNEIVEYKINDEVEFGVIKGITNVEKIDESTMKITILVKNKDILEKKEIVTELYKPLLLWQYARQTITFIVGNFTHNAMETKKDCNNLIYQIHVRDDYLEKEKMQWWDIESLKQVVMNGGHYESEYFKPYFMPVLQGLLSNI